MGINANLAKDPFESTNLAASRPEQLWRLMRGLIAGLEDHKALYPAEGKDRSRPVKPEMP